MDLPGQMVLFARVVKAGSFSAAARALGQTPSAVSRQVGNLEDRVGVRLLNRSKQGLVVTGEGQTFYERCLDISDRIADAETFANSLNDHPNGRLKVVSTVAFGKSQLLPVLPGFLSRYPDLSISMEFADRKFDLTDSNFDLAIWFTEQLYNQDDIVRKLAKNHRVVCASPLYVQKFGLPTKFTDLEHHNCLQLSTVGGWNEWFANGSPIQTAVNLSGNFEANSADAIYHATLAGLGIARLSTYLVNDDIRVGRLVRVFPEYEDESSDILAIYPQKKNLSPNVRALIDYMIETFGTVPPWERPSQIDTRTQLAG